VLVPTTLVGVAAGTWALSLLSDLWLKRVIGGTTLGFATVHLLLSMRRRSLFGAEPPWPVGSVAGLLTGIASAVAHSGGSVLGLYLVGTRLGPAAIVATSGALVAISNVVKIGGYWRIGFLTGPILLAALLATPLLVAGGWLGYRVNRVLPRRAFEFVLIGIAVAGSLRLLLGG
jgi:uncharacterized membrane protein YfcA